MSALGDKLQKKKNLTTNVQKSANYSFFILLDFLLEIIFKDNLFVLLTVSNEGVSWGVNIKCFFVQDSK